MQEAGVDQVGLVVVRHRDAEFRVLPERAQLPPAPQHAVRARRIPTVEVAHGREVVMVHDEELGPPEQLVGDRRSDRHLVDEPVVGSGLVGTAVLMRAVHLPRRARGIELAREDLGFVARGAEHIARDAGVARHCARLDARRELMDALHAAHAATTSGPRSPCFVATRTRPTVCAWLLMRLTTSGPRSPCFVATRTRPTVCAWLLTARRRWVRARRGASAASGRHRSARAGRRRLAASRAQCGVREHAVDGGGDGGRILRIEQQTRVAEGFRDRTGREGHDRQAVMHRFEEGHEETLVVAAGDEHVARFVVRGSTPPRSQVP